MNTRFFIVGLIGAALATIAITSSSIAANAPATPSATSSTSSTSAIAPTTPQTKFHGLVTAVDTTASTISINSKKEGAFTFSVTPATKIKVNKEKATLADVVVGYAAHITSQDGKTADTISAGEPKKKS